MAQNTGLSRGSQKNKQFIQDSANSFIVDAFQDMSLTAPGAPVDGEGYIVENTAGIDGSWGTITGLADGDIIRYRASKSEWQIVAKATAANQGFKAYVKDEDTLYALDVGAEWAVASGSGGGVKNFAQKQATAYKPGDWVKGNDPAFGTLGAGFRGELSVETVAPLTPKKSFKYTTSATSGNDWFYLLVDIDQYARGGAIAFTLDYTWDGDEDIRVHIWDPTFTNEYTNELNLIKNTANDDRASRNSRTIYAHPSDESQVVVGFQIATTEGTGKVFTFDNLKVTDDIGVIGSGNTIKNEVFLAGNDSRVITANTEDVHYSGTGTGWFTSGDEHYYEVQNNNSVIEIKASMAFTSDAARRCALAVNGNFYRYIGNQTPSTINYHQGSYISRTGEFQAGDRLSIRDFGGSGGTLNNVTSVHHLNIIETADEQSLRFLQVPNGEKLKDTFGAKIDGNSGTPDANRILSQSKPDWISSVQALGPVGQFRLNFTPGFFSVAPAITVTPIDVGGNAFPNILSTNNSYTDILLDIDAGSGTWQNFTVVAVKQEQDSAPDIVGVPVSIQGQTHEADSAVRVIGVSSSFTGTTNNFCVRWNILQDNVGSAVVYEDSVTEGGKFIAQSNGIYQIDCTVGFLLNTVDHGFAIVKNTPNGTVGYLSGLIANSRVAVSTSRGDGANANARQHASVSVYLKKGDVIQVQGSTATSYSTSTADSYFSMTKIGTQPLLDGGVVETVGSYTVLDGAVGPSGVQDIGYASITENVDNGDYTFDLATGRFTILNSGFYTFTVTDEMTTGGGELAIRINNIVKQLSFQSVPNVRGQISWAGYLFPGDTIYAQNSNTRGSAGARGCTFAKNSNIQQYTSRVYKEDPIAWQENVGGSSLPATFNNLEPGKTYRLILSGRIGRTGSAAEGFVQALHNGSQLARIAHGNQAASTDYGAGSDVKIFTATATSVTFASSGISVLTDCRATLEELPFHAQTSKWT